MLRDMVVEAWRASDDALIGYKEKMPIKDLEAGKGDPAVLLHQGHD